MTFADFCIYTIRKSSRLEKAVGRDGTCRFTEQKRWVTGKRLLNEAKRGGQEVAIVFAPAEATKRLFAWATIEKINIQGKRTECFFRDLRLLKSRPLKTTMKRWSDGQPLSAGFIRPYAICHKPKFVVKGG
jgi:hypothetical protein